MLEGSEDDELEDVLLDEAVLFVRVQNAASTSLLQRRFSIGFQRASKLVDLMEAKGVVGPRDGPRPRKILEVVS
jgi:S-DNA-T family DNA segregation ATPase FtsK/SpoIIIE